MKLSKPMTTRTFNAFLHTDPSSSSSIFHHLKSLALSPTTIHQAQSLFNQIHQPTLPLWNLMIRGWSQTDNPIESLRIYNLMYHQGLIGDSHTYPSLLKACARVSEVSFTAMAHARVVKLGFESLLFVSNVLISAYGCCGEMGLARMVFDEMPERDLVSWNSLICGYRQGKRFREVLGVFEAMRAAGVKADAVTMVKVGMACSALGEWGVADAMVEYIEENEVDIDVYLGNTLIDMYGRRGMVHLARGVFDRMHDRNLVSWNAMIMGYGKAWNLVAAKELFDAMPQRDVISWTNMITSYSQAGRFSEAVRLFKEMMKAKVKPDEKTVASVLSACAHIGSLDVGEAVHNYIRKYDVKADIYVGNALIDMYCKCGVVEKALEVFKDMRKKDSVSWTSVIGGLAVNGYADSALDYFSQMLREGVRPSHGAFVGILLACAHAGLIDKGLEYFESMEKVYGLTPEMKHYGCVVDLLSRSGNLQKAYEFITKMPVPPDVVVWRILLSACQLHGNIPLAEVATTKLLELDPSNSCNYVLSSNTYAGSNRWEDAIKMRGLMEESNVQKPSDCKTCASLLEKIANQVSAIIEWEGRMNVGMSNSVTTAIRGSVREMAIGKTKTTEKADRAIVEQAIDPRTCMVLFKMLNRGVFHDINGCISSGKEVCDTLEAYLFCKVIFAICVRVTILNKSLNISLLYFIELCVVMKFYV